MILPKEVILVMQGDQVRRDQMAALVLTTLAGLGLNIQWGRGKRGRDIIVDGASMAKAQLGGEVVQLAWPEQRFAQFQTMLEAQDRVPEVVEVIGPTPVRDRTRTASPISERQGNVSAHGMRVAALVRVGRTGEERGQVTGGRLGPLEGDDGASTKVVPGRAGVDSPQKRVNLGVTPAKVKVRLRLEDFKVVAVLQTGTRTARALVTYTRRNGPGWAGREGKTWGGARRCGWRCSSR